MTTIVHEQPAQELDFVSGSLADQAYARLRQTIIQCTFMPGQRLTEAGIVEHLAMSKTPVREACQRLVRDGLLLVEARQGYRIASITLRDVQNMFGLRRIVEPAAAELATGRLDVAQLRRLNELCHAGYNIHDAASVTAFQSANSELHNIIARASGNQRLANVIDQLVDESERIIRFAMLLNPRSAEAIHEHTQIIDALSTSDSAAARQAMLEHTDASGQMILDSLLSSAALREVPLSVP